MGDQRIEGEEHMSMEAMKMALEALRKARRKILTTEECHATITFLNNALAKQEQGEPVAWMQEGQPELYVEEQKDEKRGYVIPLYTHPQPKREWVELTEEDYVCVHQLCKTPIQGAEYAAHLLKEKNT
jgi:hypothetical protein